MRIATLTALLVLSAATTSVPLAGAFVSPAPRMAMSGRGAEGLAGSKPVSSRPLASKPVQQDATAQQGKGARGLGGAAAPLGAVALPATDRLPLGTWDKTSDEGTTERVW